MRNTVRLIICICFSLLACSQVSAQQPSIKASADSTHILIGQQTMIHLEISAQKDAQLQLPFMPDTLARGVEVLDISHPDTVDLGNDRIQIKYDYLITSFDSALYVIRPFPLIVQGDTIYSNDLALKVSTFPVDTESKQFFDIKELFQPEIVLKDYLPVLFGILIGILVILGAIYLIYRIKNKKSLLPSFKKEEPQLPPHIRAINDLNEVKEQKLWQQGKVKEFHSEVTDILRTYIEGRFGINAMEMTSDEILTAMHTVEDGKKVFDSLKQTLLLAYLVKFAKFQPFADENERSLSNAYLFVEETTIKEVEASTDEPQPEKTNQEETKD